MATNDWSYTTGYFLLDDSIKSNIALEEEENKIDDEKIFEAVNQKSQLRDLTDKLPQKKKRLLEREVAVFQVVKNNV